MKLPEPIVCASLEDIYSLGDEIRARCESMLLSDWCPMREAYNKLGPDNIHALIGLFLRGKAEGAFTLDFDAEAVAAQWGKPGGHRVKSDGSLADEYPHKRGGPPGTGPVKR